MGCVAEKTQCAGRVHFQPTIHPHFCQLHAARTEIAFLQTLKESHHLLVSSGEVCRFQLRDGQGEGVVASELVRSSARVTIASIRSLVVAITDGDWMSV